MPPLLRACPPYGVATDVAPVEMRQRALLVRYELLAEWFVGRRDRPCGVQVFLVAFMFMENAARDVSDALDGVPPRQSLAPATGQPGKRAAIRVILCHAAPVTL